MSSALLAIAEVVPRKGAGSTRTRKTVAFSPKNGQLEVAAKPAGVRPFSYWEISRLRVRRDGTDTLPTERSRRWRMRVLKLKSRLLLLQCPFYRILSKTEIHNNPPFSLYSAHISKSIFMHKLCIIMVVFCVHGHILSQTYSVQ